MSIEAVVAYCARADGRIDSPNVVRDAARAGYVFSAAELAACLQVRDWLERARNDAALRAEVLAAREPRAALAEAARRANAALDPDVFAAVLRAATAGADELEPEALDRVIGGVRSVPEKEDEVLVSFLNGDARAPVVLGSLWNGKSKPPTSG